MLSLTVTCCTLAQTLTLMYSIVLTAEGGGGKKTKEKPSQHHRCQNCFMFYTNLNQTLSAHFFLH